MSGYRARHYYPSQRVTHTVCPDCAAPVIEFVERGMPHRIDAGQAPITRTPIDYHRDGRMVWRLNLPTGRWGYDPGSPRSENPVHLNHECPTPGRP